MKKSNVYTQTGDHGTTGLIGGTRVPKNHLRLHAYGTVDELNSNIGVLISTSLEKSYDAVLQIIQHKLFSIGGYLATDQTQVELKSACSIYRSDVQKIESFIDQMDEKLPKLEAFILPAGTSSACAAHVCRTVCRRAERAIIELSFSVEVDPILLIYINRLSDFFFVLARSLNNDAGEPEIVWNKSCE